MRACFTAGDSGTNRSEARECLVTVSSLRWLLIIAGREPHVSVPAGLPAIIASLGSEKSAERELIRIGPAAAVPLAGALKGADRAGKVRILRLLGGIGDPRARIALVRALRGRDTGVRQAVRRALERLRRTG
ncbi:HEAT repeat domain-containing protein [Methanoculleus frigidifontis]|uniref:HEAT repeat domain-containing protein n=1 Tax=Methanoculleus frigidifontis TaxID=2584085 RepID=UPI00265ACCB2|nr:hypothetical protein [Methanoculleus sp. FWC-SCC1]